MNKALIGLLIGVVIAAVVGVFAAYAQGKSTGGALARKEVLDAMTAEIERINAARRDTINQLQGSITARQASIDSLQAREDTLQMAARFFQRQRDSARVALGDAIRTAEEARANIDLDTLAPRVRTLVLAERQVAEVERKEKEVCSQQLDNCNERADNLQTQVDSLEQQVTDVEEQKRLADESLRDVNTVLDSTQTELDKAIKAAHPSFLSQIFRVDAGNVVWGLGGVVGGYILGDRGNSCPQPGASSASLITVRLGFP